MDKGKFVCLCLESPTQTDIHCHCIEMGEVMMFLVVRTALILKATAGRVVITPSIPSIGVLRFWSAL